MSLFRRDERKCAHRILRKFFRRNPSRSYPVQSAEREYRITGYTEKDIDIFLDLPQNERRRFERGGVVIPSIEGNIPYHLRKDMPNFSREKYEESVRKFIEHCKKSDIIPE
ncbi:MAG: hypothetical protein WDZ40_04085 [Candidatus Spechtbacterales bacterium]